MSPLITLEQQKEQEVKEVGISHHCKSLLLYSFPDKAPGKNETSWNKYEKGQGRIGSAGWEAELPWEGVKGTSDTYLKIITHINKNQMSTLKH